jgi:hypothetical protein
MDRSKNRRTRSESVIINYLHVVGITVVPTKTESQLVVDANAVLALSVDSQGFQPVSGRTRHIGQDHSAI